MRPIVLLLTAAVAATGLSVPAAAMTRPGHGLAPRPLEAGFVRHDGGGLSLDQAVDLVKRRYDARVVRAEEAREGEEIVYRIRLLAADGRVFTVRVNARTGRVD